MPKAELERDLFMPAPLPQAALDDVQRLACLRLIRSENVGPATFRELINHCGGAQNALDALPGLAARGGRRAIRICPRDVAEAELDAARAVGALPVFTIEPGYPRYLARIDVPPPMLYVKGRTALLSREALAIVGARNGSALGQQLTRHMADEVGKAGYVVVSGLARGIDGAAHQAALATGTIAVLAGGVDNIYPPEHAQLHARIGVEGCLVSEMPPGFKPRGQDFPRRNRIISGLALGVLVMEAAKRSGSLITARVAAEQGREVMAVPGHPLDPRAEGTNGLLKDGVTLVTSPADVLAVLAPMAGRITHELAGSEARAMPLLRLPADTPPSMTGGGSGPASEHDRQHILAALGPAPAHVDEIVRASGLPVSIVQAVLLELAIAGRIERHGGQLVSLLR